MPHKDGAKARIENCIEFITARALITFQYVMMQRIQDR